MNALEDKLREYQMQAGQWLDRKRALENQAVEAGRNAELIQQRIAGIQEAMELLNVDEQPSTDSTKVVARKRSRSLSGNWQLIMQIVDAQPSFDYDALAEAAHLVAHDVGRDTLRSQMSLYKQSGLVDAVGDGEFRLTDAGRKAAGIPIDVEDVQAVSGDGELS